MKHTIKLLTLVFMLATILTLTGCPGPVNNYIEPAHEHVFSEWSEWEIVTAATCTENGSKKRTRTCSCGEVEKETAVIAALGHSVDNWNTVQTLVHTKEELKDEIKEGVCSRCGETVRKTTQEAHHHVDYETSGYCETCGGYKFENHYTVRVYTSRDEFIADNYTPMLRLSSNNENNNLYDECKFSFESENPSMTLNTLIHKKLRYQNYSVMAYKKINTGNTILTLSGNEIISDIYSIYIYIEPTN